MLGGAAADRHHVVVREGLLYIVEGAFVDRLNRRLQRRLRRHEDDRRLGVLSPHGRENFDTRNPGHLEVRQDDIGRRALELLETRLTALRGGDIEPLVFQQDAEGFEDPLFVVDDEYGWGSGHYAASSLRRAAGK